MENSDEIIIKTEYSAVAAKNPNPSRAVQAAISAFRRLELSRITEIGCGLLANTPHFLREFPFVILIDTKHQYTRIKDNLDEMSKLHSSFRGFIDVESFQHKRMQLDGAIIINVLHILPTIEERMDVLKGVYQNLKKGGFLFIDVPRNETYYRNAVKTAIPHNDGNIMRRGSYYTFYKNMSFEELRTYAEEVGFQLVQRIYLNHRVTFICQKRRKRR